MDQRPFSAASLPDTDPCIAKELGRQQGQIELIASENIVSRAVMQAQGSEAAEDDPTVVLVREQVHGLTARFPIYTNN